MGFSIIIPTIGRQSIVETLNSIYLQPLFPADEIIIVNDGHNESLERLVYSHPLKDRIRYFCAFASHNLAHHPCTFEYSRRPQFGGHIMRNFGVMLARGDYLLHIDDDDVFLPGAFEAVRKCIMENPFGFHVFRIFHTASNKIIWETPEIKGGNISTQCYVVFNDINKMGRWGISYTGDFDFAVATERLWGKAYFHEPVIAWQNKPKQELLNQGILLDKQPIPKEVTIEGDLIYPDSVTTL